MSELIERVKRYCDVAGMEPSEPLRLALMAVCEAAERVQHAPPATAEAIAERAACMINVSMDRAAVTLTKGRMWALAASAAIALYAVSLGGFGIGWIWQSSRIAELQDTMTGLHRQAFRDGKAAADQWLAVETYNHVADVTKCRVTVVDGRRRCDTSIWLDPAPQAAPGR